MKIYKLFFIRRLGIRLRLTPRKDRRKRRGREKKRKQKREKREKLLKRQRRKKRQKRERREKLLDRRGSGSMQSILDNKRRSNVSRRKLNVRRRKLNARKKRLKRDGKMRVSSRRSRMRSIAWKMLKKKLLR